MKVERVRIVVRGAVQGVGFRPFIFRLSEELGLHGWVLNSSQGVFIEVEAEMPRLEEFLIRLSSEAPPRSVIQSLEPSFLEAKGYTGFEIRHSDDSGAKTTLILPDIATCADCLREVLDPDNRRYRYPFTNCTNCGPRFSIIESLPYDRPNTSMKRFAMCLECEAEYRDPHDRRFHAQPTACPVCGPILRLLDAEGHGLGVGHEALLAAAEAIRKGGIVALKGLGGFQLIVDARNEDAVAHLRWRKHRGEKPLAIMATGLDQARRLCQVSDLEARLLGSAEAPIVLMRRDFSRRAELAPSVSPDNPNLGVMLPYTPLHHLLMRELGFPVVATSGNLSDEPICIDEAEALVRLRGIADGFLVHDRPIVRHVDDSVARILLGREQILRRARGYAPLPLPVSRPAPRILGVGAHLKNSIALGLENQIFVSQHIGDLETAAANQAFLQVCLDFQHLYDTAPDCVARDLHPDYVSTRFAAGLRINQIAVQHHFAHVASCMAENELDPDPPVLGISWDGTGYGPDGTIWGGEFLIADGTPFTRAAHFRSFRLPGSEAAVREPRRCALGVLYEISGDSIFEHPGNPPMCHFGDSERNVLRQLLARGIRAPVTSSVGRLFDAVASLLGLRQRAGFEGQAAMELEFAAMTRAGETREAYPCDLRGGDPVVIDWEPMILEILRDMHRNLDTGLMAAKFHHGLVEAAVLVAQRIGLERVAISGGCFQNRILTETLVRRLREEGFRPFWHQRIPASDGGIALGQVAAAAWQIAAEKKAGAEAPNPQAVFQ